VAAYRQAIEALAAVAEQIANDSAADDSPQDIVDALVEDLSDGVIDGENEDGAIDALTGLDEDIATTLTTVDLATLLIPGTDRPVSDVELELVDEMAATGESADTDALEGGIIEVDLQQPETVVDSDGDGMDDLNDDFPSDPAEWLDSDADGVGDNSDAFPLDATEWMDSDSDGVGDNADAFPNDSTEWLDSDSDGVGDNADAFPNDATESLDTDSDGVGDNADVFPNDPAEWLDSDNDGVGDNADVDLDDDGLIEISGWADLDAMRNDPAGTSLNGDATGCPAGGCFGYELITDLDFDSNLDGVIDSLDAYYNSGAFWQPIGDFATPFTGTFNGNGFKIRNLVIYRPADTWVGLFGVLDGATVTDLGLVGELTSVSGDEQVGAIAGRADNGATIRNCYVAGGTLDATTEFGGGIVGFVPGPATITTSFSTASVNCGPNGHCGGLTGFAITNVTIENSFSTGSVSTQRDAGGLAGSVSYSSTVLNSYAAGPVVSTDPDQNLTQGLAYLGSGTVTASYWDKQTTGQALSGFYTGAIGLTTAEMQCPTGPDDTGCKAGTTLYAGWDAAVWDFGTSSQYPALIIGGNVYRDSDADGIWDFEDDSDGDGVFDNIDAFPNDPTEWTDTDGDGVGDNTDNCLSVANPSQSDANANGIGDACDCDSDTDGDGYFDDVDDLPNDPTEWADTDGDGVGDNSDSFPTDPTEWTDTDGDGVGDNADAFPTDPTEWVDSDGDGVGDNSDGFPTDPTRWTNGDVDADHNGLIEIRSWADLDETRNDLAGTSLFGNSNGCPAGGCFGYELTCDLDFDSNADGVIDLSDDYYNSGAFWLPIGDSANPFTGTFNGNGFAIHNLVVYQSVASNIGLFGALDGATVTDLGLRGELTWMYGSSSVGLIAGQAINGSTINNCLTGGAVEGRNTGVGGLVGQLTQSSITASYSTAAVSVSNTGICGGLVGYASTGTIENSFAAGSVTCPSYVGGLVGYMQNTTILDSYAAGAVSGNSSLGGLVGMSLGGNAITAGYWDTEASGQATSGGNLGTGLTTTEMQCPTGPDDTGCKVGTTIYQGWSAALWDFGTSSQYPALILQGKVYRDTDGDQYFDFQDAFPSDPTEWLDSDGDGVGDNSDAFPTDPTESVDTDGDGVGDNSDLFPTWPSESVDTDGDGIGNNSDNCPDTFNPDQADSDLGGITGVLDHTFGDDVSPVNGIPDGFVLPAVIGASSNSVNAVVTDTNGNIILAGHSNSAATSTDMALWRLTPDGALDTGFGGGAGYVTHHNAAGGNSIDSGSAVALDAAGNIYVAGYSWNGSDQDMVLWRFTPDGALDTTFAGGAGYVVHNGAAGGNGPDGGSSVALDAAGNIYVTGDSDNLNGDQDMALWRFTPDGVLDTTFGGGMGYVTHNNAAGGNGTDQGKGVALDGSGNIYVTGQSRTVNYDYDMVLWRFTPDGDLDTSFGGGAGFVVQSATAGGSNRDDVGNEVAVGTDTNIYVAGSSKNPNGDFDMVLWRFTSTGDLDTSFGGGAGFVTHNNAAGGDGYDVGNSVVLDAAGNIYVAGQSANANANYDMALWRYTPDGDLDTGFGGGSGFVSYDVNGFDNGNAVTLDGDGNVLVAGFAYSAKEAILWRFAPSPDGYGDVCDAFPDDPNRW